MQKASRKKNRKTLRNGYCESVRECNLQRMDCPGVLTFLRKPEREIVTELSAMMKKIDSSHTGKRKPSPRFPEPLCATLREAFLENLFHEFRTPMNSIQGLMDLLKEGYFEGEERDHCQRRMKEEMNHFLAMINDLVALSLFQAGEEVPVQTGSQRLENLMVSLQKQFEDRCLQKEIFIHYYNPDPSRLVRTDLEKLQRTLWHLLDNAVKFSEGGAILYGYKEEVPGELCFFVRNTGSVIPEDIRDHMFEVFEKVPNEKGRIYPGLGIGLTLSRRYVELLGGSIDWKSDPARGTLFCFNLPGQSLG